MKYIYIQGNYVPEDEAAIPVKNRGFRFGDGIFETIRVQDGRAYNKDFHFNRLNTGLKAISLQTIDISSLCNELITKNNLLDGFVRISVSRDGVSKGYMPSDIRTYVIGETLEGIKSFEGTARLFVSSYKSTATIPAKTMNGLNYSLALLQASEHGCDNALMLDHEGYVCETASGNIFWVKGGVVYTPSTELPLIPGSIRERVLSLTNVKQVKAKLNELENADEIFMTNVNHLVLPFAEMKPAGIKYFTEKAATIRHLIKNDIKAELG